MGLLRLLVIALYPACLALVMARRPRQAAEEAARLGGRVELGVWAQSPRRLRVLVLIAVALLLTCAGRFGAALGVVFALITAPIAAAGSLRRLTVTSNGVLIDSQWWPWSELSGWTLDPRSRRLILLPRDAARPSAALALGRLEMAAAAAALSRHIPEIRPEIRDVRADVVA